MKIKKQEGYTLLELIMVISIMTMISIGVMQDKMAELSQIKAKGLGVEIGTVANSIGAYVDYYAGVDPGIYPDSPSDGDTQTGINFLKSNNCTAAETSSSGPVEHGFMQNCSYLSNLANPALDQRTTFGNLQFDTKFTRTLIGGDPFVLESQTVMTPLVGNNGQVMQSESGLAATVAGGVRLSVGGGWISQPHNVFYCVTDKGGFQAYVDACTGNVGSIVFTIGNDATTSAYLRTDGGNEMNNKISFNEIISDTMRYIENLKSIKYKVGETFVISENVAGATPVFELDKDSLKIFEGDGDNNFLTVNNVTNELIFQTESAGDVRKLEVKHDHLTTNKRVVSDKSVSSTVFLPFTTEAGVDSSQGHKLVIDGDSELKDVGVDKVVFGSSSAGSNVSRLGSSTNPNIESTNTSGELKINAEKLQLRDLSSPTNEAVEMTGIVDTKDLMIKMKNGSFKSLNDLLPRYSFLGAEKIISSGITDGRPVYTATYAGFGCSPADMKIIVTRQSSYVTTSNSFNGNYMGVNWAAFSVKPGYSNAGGTSYTLSNYTGQAGFGNVQVKVSSLGGNSGWTVALGTSGSKNSGHTQARNYEGGEGLAQIYCLNELD